ncbi:MAG: signal peptidase II [Gammaproteobacteria bacterium]
MLRWLWLSAVVIVLDQATKYLASGLLDYGVPVPVLPFFNLTLAHNPGAAFSFLAEASGWQRWFFIGIALVVSVLIVGWMKRLSPRENWLAAALALILGGAIGNVIDRVMYGYVVDFIDLYYGAWHWPAFNIADSAITVGVAIMLIDSLLFSRETTPGAVGKE